MITNNEYKRRTMKKSMMNSKLIYGLVIIFGLFVIGNTVLARGGSRSYSSRSSRSYSSRKSGGYGSKKTTTPKKKTASQIKADKAKSQARAKQVQANNLRKAEQKREKLQKKTDAKAFKKINTKKTQPALIFSYLKPVTSPMSPLNSPKEYPTST